MDSTQTTFPWKIIQTLFAEFVCTIIFGYTVYGAILVANITEIGSPAILVGLAIAFSSISIIYAFIDVTVAHFNPAITLAAMIFGFLDCIQGLGFIAAQLLGFVCAVAFILLSFPDNNDILNTINPAPVSSDVSTGDVIGTEVFLTAFLIFVVFAVAVNKYKKPVQVITPEEDELVLRKADKTPDTTILAPLVIGLTLGFCGLIGGATSGGAFNPGIVFGPVLLSGNWSNSWKYWVGEFIGLLVGGIVQMVIVKRLS